MKALRKMISFFFQNKFLIGALKMSAALIKRFAFKMIFSTECTIGMVEGDLK